MSQKFHFENGAQVQLNSGGPAMTVDNTRLDEYVNCYWFDGAELKNEAFHHLAVRRVDGEKPIDPDAARAATLALCRAQ